MFETATLTNGPAGKRVWTTLLGFSSQVALVSIAVLAPMVWPQVLPITSLQISLAPPVPPGPKPLGDATPKKMVKVAKGTFIPLDRYEPRTIPSAILTEVEEPPSGPLVIGSLPGERSGPGSELVNAIIGGAARDSATLVRPPVVVAAKPEPAAPAIIRYKEGGRVQLGSVLHRGVAMYPAIAKAAHATGDVSLECVVSYDGHIKEVKVKSGNPLLVKAAVDAAWQWVYAPSQLNGDPIEIVTIMTFSFKLN